MVTKICQRCGREIEYRKKWERDWEQVKYCSQKCKSFKNNSNFSEKILELLKKRGTNKTICPSEVLAPEDKKDKHLMEEVRKAARLLAHEGTIEITQKNQVIDFRYFKGPIRIRLISK